LPASCLPTRTAHDHAEAQARPKVGGGVGPRMDRTHTHTHTRATRVQCSADVSSCSSTGWMDFGAPSGTSSRWKVVGAGGAGARCCSSAWSLLPSCAQHTHTEHGALSSVAATRYAQLHCVQFYIFLRSGQHDHNPGGVGVPIHVHAVDIVRDARLSTPTSRVRRVSRQPQVGHHQTALASPG
jgi:hypothetical protein